MVSTGDGCRVAPGLDGVMVEKVMEGVDGVMASGCPGEGRWDGVKLVGAIGGLGGVGRVRRGRARGSTVVEGMALNLERRKDGNEEVGEGGECYGGAGPWEKGREGFRMMDGRIVRRT